MTDQLSRRRFLKGLGVAGAAAAAPVAILSNAAEKKSGQLAAAQPATPSPQPPTNKKPAALRQQAYTFFTAPEAAFVEAVISRLIPADNQNPGALEAGVSYFIDEQLDGVYGTMGKNYRQGPWGEGTPEQGYQLPLTPQQVYRIGIGNVNDHCNGKYGKSFNALSPAQQDGVLNGLEKGEVELADLPGKTFFEMVYANTVEGFFADPAYGGNRDKAGWKMVGFPGVAAAYVGLIEQYNQPYNRMPVSLGDMQQRLVQIDHHGHPIHPLIEDIAKK